MSTLHLEGLEELISIDELSDYPGVPVKTTAVPVDHKLEVHRHEMAPKFEPTSIPLRHRHQP